MKGMWAITKGVFSLPVGVLVSVVHRLAVGKQAVVEVRINQISDVLERQAVIHRVRRMAGDERVQAVLLRIEAPPGGYAACSDLREAVSIIRKAGKPVYAYLEAPGNTAIWIASACTQVFLVPSGEVGLVGLGTELTFFGAGLERLGVQPDFEAAGEYKSFGEAFTRSFPSRYNHEAMTSLIEGLQHQMLVDIATSRGFATDDLEAMLAQAPMGAEFALELGLVDRLMYEDELFDWLEETHGKETNRISMARWEWGDGTQESIDSWGQDQRMVVVLHLDGPIVLESSGVKTQIQARKVVPILRRLREMDEVRAVVLHINSPGGSGLASDLIWREVVALRKAKPVIASFEDVSASGGFYLAAPANEILVRAGTLTGSIGVFGGKMVAGEALRKFGVHIHEIAVAPNATMYTPHKRFTDGQRFQFRKSLQRFYDGFVERVATGRGVPVEKIEPHCRGRVWTGADAVALGLVDRIGNLHDAVERARVLADLRVGAFVRVDASADPKTYVQEMMGQAAKQYSPLAATLETASRFLPASSTLAQVVLQHPGQLLAMMPFEVRLR